MFHGAVGQDPGYFVRSVARVGAGFQNDPVIGAAVHGYPHIGEDDPVLGCGHVGDAAPVGRSPDEAARLVRVVAENGSAGHVRRRARTFQVAHDPADYVVACGQETSGQVRCR